MIDEKKINQATYKYLEEEGYKPYIEQSFKDGAVWVQREYVKSLWHAPVVEAEPRRDIIAMSKKGMVYAFNFEYDDDWRQTFRDCNIERFCYLDDMLLKKGGEK